jgi:gliding motility-associated-like protein
MKEKRIKAARLIAVLCLIIIHKFSYSQDIVSSDTVCVGVPVPFSLSINTNSTTYVWEFGTNSMVPILSTAIPVPNTASAGNTFTVVDQATMVYDTANNNFYAFVTSAGPGYSFPSVQRLDFGSNPHSVPITTDLGNPNNVFISPSYSNLEAVEIVLDETGIYHAFFANRGIVHWVFGNGLNNPPTQVSRIFDNPAVLGMGMQMAVMKVGGQWIIFCGQSFGINNIVRFDLGTNINALPVIIPYTILPAPTGGFVGAPCYFAILKESGSWHMQVSPLSLNAPLYRYDFGVNIQNNSPTITDQGVISPVSVNLNRGLNFIKSCNSFYMLGLNQDGEVLSLNYQNNINNTPVSSSLGQVYGPNVNMVVLKPYWYNDTLWALSGNWNSNLFATVYRFPLLAIPSGNAVIKYYDPTTTYTFSSPGIYDVTIYCDQADPRGPQTFCKQIVVVNNNPDILEHDTTICAEQNHTLDAYNTEATGYLWSTGATTSSINVSQSGTYWVQVTGPQCVNGSDTIHIQFATPPVVQIIPENPVFCMGETVTLHVTGTGSYKWSPFTYLSNEHTATTVANPPITTMYYVTVTDPQGCEGKDSVLVTAAPNPVIDATAEYDKITCDLTSLQLRATGGVSYSWEPAALCDNPYLENPTISTDKETTFYVTGKNEFGCENKDSIKIQVIKSPVFFVPNAFSPNQDGKNDFFMPRVDCGFVFKKFNVYNRYGQLVYSTQDVDNGWDGSFKGKKADIGTYHWFIIGRDTQGNEITRKGNVILLF